MNSDLAWKVFDRIADLHYTRIELSDLGGSEPSEIWNQDVWLRCRILQDGTCQTVGCFAGWTCILSGDRMAEDDDEDDLVLTPEGKVTDVLDRALEHLGLTAPEVHENCLFAAGQTLADLEEKVESVFGARP